MRRTTLVLLMIATGVLLVAGSAAAQNVTEGESVAVKLAPWLKGPVATSWLVLAIAGALGAWTIAIAAVGGAFPGTAGAADIRKMEVELDDMRERNKARQTDGVASDADAASLPTEIVELRHDILRAKTRQWLLAAPAYVLLGAGLAALFAQDPIQAIGIGVAGPGFASQLVAGKQRKELSEEKNKKMEEAEGLIQDLVTPRLAHEEVQYGPDTRDENAPQKKNVTIKHDAETERRARAAIANLRTARKL